MKWQNGKWIHISIFIIIIGVLCIFNDKQVWAYGENIYGFQTHYEIQNQYKYGDYLVIEGFYYIYELQNFTDNTKGSGTHYYYLELNNGARNYTYYDTGNYYIDLTNLEFKSGYPWASYGESDLTWPSLSGYNYRYRDIGFQFIIPLSDLKNFTGENTDWKLNITCVATNTWYGRGVEISFKQQNIYASKSFSTVNYEDYSIRPYTSLYQQSSNIIADVGYVRVGPSKASGIVNYYGYNLYWGYQEVFYDLSISAANSTGYDTVTWYALQFGNIYYDGRRYRVRYSNQTGFYGWIPSVFMGSLNGTPYTIKVHNEPPVIFANDLFLDEGTMITESTLLEGVSAYDYSFGTKIPSIKSTNLILNSKNNSVGTYFVTYYVVDANQVETTKSITVNIIDKITRQYIRSISLSTIGTLSDLSKWNQGVRKAYLEEILRRLGDKKDYVQSWEFSNEDRITIQKEMTKKRPSKELNNWFLHNYQKNKSWSR